MNYSQVFYHTIPIAPGTYPGTYPDAPEFDEDEPEDQIPSEISRDDDDRRNIEL